MEVFMTLCPKYILERGISSFTLIHTVRNLQVMQCDMVCHFLSDTCIEMDVDPRKMSMTRHQECLTGILIFFHFAHLTDIISISMTETLHSDRENCSSICLNTFKDSLIHRATLLFVCIQIKSSRYRTVHREIHCIENSIFD